jgi:type I restriction enzyme R subunit
LEYVKAFREVMRINAQLENFVEYDQDDTDLNKAEFQKHTSQYKYLYNNVRVVQPKDKVSVLNDVNFQLELIHRDTVNVGYILNLLQSVVNIKILKRNSSIVPRCKISSRPITTCMTNKS